MADYQNVVARIRTHFYENEQIGEMNDDVLKEKIKDYVFNANLGEYVPLDHKLLIIDQVYSSIRGLGLIDTIMKDDTITEVMINGCNNVFIEQKGVLTKSDYTFESDEKLLDIVRRFVGIMGREITEAEPIVDTRLKDGSRVNVVIPPISLEGPIVTIRKFSKTPMTMEWLIQHDAITSPVADVLKLLVEARYNIFIAGGTGSGKTTFLNALSNFIPRDERIITIEDSAELQIRNVDNLVRLETRNKNSSGEGEKTMQDLIKSSLRMRPDRIVVGEVRGEEALDMLQAMNTGHDGSLSTGHANSSFDMLSRLETMVMRGASGLPLEAVRQQIASALDIIVHLSRLRDHSRKVMEIVEVVGYSNGVYQLNPLFKFEEDRKLGSKHKVVGQLKRTENAMVKTYKLRNFGYEKDI